MYSHCIGCSRRFGIDSSIQGLPLNAHFAFDQIQGRLWLICERCGEWNLWALEERWELLQECGALFERSRDRIRVDGLSIAEVNGIKLTNVGKSTLPDMLAWRYGRRITHKVRRTQLRLVQFSSGSLAAGVVGWLGGLWNPLLPLGLLVGAVWAHVAVVGASASSRPVWVHCEPGAPPRFVSAKQLLTSNLEIDKKGELSLEIGATAQPIRVFGTELTLLLMRFLPRINGISATPDDVSRAVELAEVLSHSAGPVVALVDRVRRRSIRLDRRKINPREWLGMTNIERVALEIMLNQEFERRVLAGDAAILRRAHEQAEKIAAIADNLLIPDALVESFHRLRRQAHRRHFEGRSPDSP